MSPDRLAEINARYHMFSAISPEIPEDAGFLFSAKDNLTSAGMETKCGSRILEGYVPVFDAAAIERMKAAGGALVGKTNMDEFGFGTFSVNSAFGVPLNPFDPERSCGGSSGGSACAAAVLEGHVSLGVSTGGSVSCPASFCGVYGLTPTYGRVSRHGLIDYGNSLDKVGLLSADAPVLGRRLAEISGRDPRDPTSCAQPELSLSGKRISSVAAPEEALRGVSGAVGEAFKASLDRIRESGADVETISMPSLRYAIPAYYVIATCEASTNLARYVGMRYGRQDGDLSLGFDDYFASFRTEYFGDEAKRRILLGTYARMAGFRDRYYAKALRVRAHIIESYKEAFGRFDAVATPTMPFIAPRFSEISAMSPVDSFAADFLTVPPNLAGIPHLSVPCGYSEGMPIGLHVSTDHWREDLLASFAEDWSESFKAERAGVGQ
ncbi:MAG: Asp-tRNA(Asn)/Glu-tRNA(Gln) amidotransferase subunit GatA [Candidatus Methanoplasma sp.]|jgi:aspartyl-tRNA(Asn)/glutamyl-tRNA(Gln) amidotransferase subunit A|nr:Asp-tRNA(Asn)/Glu-tRNA(Gln) amidotransferase subunit GatA [Candidatus Methanoplasma sp.]